MYDDTHEDEWNDAELARAEREDGQLDEVATGASAWGISIVLHVIAVLVLVFVVTIERTEPEKAPLRVVTIDAPEKPKVKDTERDLVKKVVPEIDTTEVTDVPLVTELDLPVTEPEVEADVPSEVKTNGNPDAMAASETGNTGAFMAIGAGGASAGAFGLRGGGRKYAVGKYGGTKASEGAVDAALEWFARHQSPNGQWDVDGYQLNCAAPGTKCEPGTAHTGSDGDVACTAYAVMCFLAGGYDQRTGGRYRKVVRAGVDWLVSQQAADGSFGKRNYEHPIAVMALAEAYAMTNERPLRKVVEDGVAVILQRQAKSPEGYPLGWDYSKPNAARNDSSVTGWNVMALKAAKAGGLDVGHGMHGAKRWLEGAWKAANPKWRSIGSDDVSVFPYSWNASTNETKHDSRVPMGLLSGVFLGLRGGDPMLESMGNYVMAKQVPTSYPTNTYYMYYNTLAIFQMGGNRWKEWNNVARDVLVKAQRTGGDCFDGSWDWENTGFHGHDTGRLLSTAYCCLSLEVYYRYLPVAAQKH
ncbi:MAG: terpene cyclase/mutase family protein [Planctomycetota bacterium]|jgi:hypothetical protein|nr:terpene cyclase/mutase family protein [Planctomycetota bacterium]